MDLKWLGRNLATSWRHSATLGDSLKRLRWTYAERLGGLCPAETFISFKYADPIGCVRFLVRANRGSDAFILSEVFEHRYYDLGLPSPPATVLDLGANTGFTATYFSRVYPDALLACVEPHPLNVQVLRTNLHVNGVDAEIFPMAVGNVDGVLTLELNSLDYGHRIVTNGSHRSGAATLEVPALTVPTLMRRLNWPRIGLLKVDIEGYEKALFGDDCDWMHLVDAMCIECHEGFGDQDLDRLATTFNFLPPSKLPGIWLMRRT